MTKIRLSGIGVSLMKGGTKGTLPTMRSRETLLPVQPPGQSRSAAPTRAITRITRNCGNGRSEVMWIPCRRFETALAWIFYSSPGCVFADGMLVALFGADQDDLISEVSMNSWSRRFS